MPKFIADIHYSFSLKPMENNTYSNKVLNDNPIAYWALDESSGTVADNLGSVDSLLDATYSGSPQLGVAGLADGSGAALFDGSDDKILLNSHSDLNTGTYGEKTIELWFSADDTDGTQVLYEQGGYTNGLNIYLDGGTINMGAWRSDNGAWLNTSISAGQTYHVAFVFDAGTLSGYLNGALIGTTSSGFSEIASHSDTGAIAQVSGGTRLSNSSTTTSSNNFAGTIDNVALYNSALSVEQVTEHYDARSQASAISPVPLTNIGVVTPVPISPISPIDGGSSGSNRTTFTGGSDDNVLVGNSANNIITGDSSQQSLNLDGHNDYVEVANGANLHITNEITVETWIKVDTFNRTWQAIATKGDESWRLHRYRNSNVLNFAVGSGSRSVTGQTNVNDGQWHHVAATFNGEYVRLYVNGELDGEVYSPGDIPQTNHRILLGSNAQRLGRNFNGQLDDVQIWDVARTQDEIRASMKDGILANIDSPLYGLNEGLVGHWSFETDRVTGDSITDLSGNGYQGTLRNGQGNNFVAEVPAGNDRLVGGAGNDHLMGGGGNDTLIGDDLEQTLSLDGSNDYVAVATSSSLDLSTTGTFTLETQLNSTASDNSFHGIMGYHPGPLEDRYPGMWIINKTSIHFGFGDGTNWYHRTVNNVLTEGNWHHVAMTFDGTSLKLYVDAQEVFSTNAYAGKVPNTTQQIEIGKASGYFFEGQLDNVGVWNIARTDAEIQESMNGGVTGSESGLVGYWTFDENTVLENEISDLSGNGNTGVVTNGQGNNLVASVVGGNDLLEGGTGNDELWGNGGGDTLSGQAGNDTLTGGTGADRYVFESVTDGIDVIKDFNAAEGDRIVLAESFGANTLERLSFDGATGALSYDGVQFATLENVTSLDIYTAVESELYNPTLFSIEEHGAVGTVVGAVSIANPAAENAYAIAAGNDDDIFTIDANTGAISVADDKQLDFEAAIYHPLQVQTVDAAGNLSTTAVLISVTDAVNEAPLLNSQGFVVSESVSPGTVLGTITARDDDGDSITFEIVGGNDDGRFAVDSATGEIKLADDAATLDYAIAARHEFQVRVTDAQGNSRDESMLVIVDSNPIAAADTFTTDEETPISGNLLADNGSGADTDPEGSAVTLTEVNGYAFEAGQPIDIGSLAQVTVNADGSFDYDPNGQFDYLAAGETATDSFSYTVQDEAGGVDTATVSVEISGVNDAPVAVADEFDAFTNRAFNGNLLKSNGLGADYDVDASDQLAVSEIWIGGVAQQIGQQITLASGALLTVNADGSFDYDPNGQVADGTIETFDYVLSDGVASSQMVTATLNVADELVIDLTEVARDGDTRGFVINGSQAGAYSGFDVSMAGDINGDGYGDFIIGAPKTDGGVVEGDLGTDLVGAGGTEITSSFLDLDWDSEGFINGNGVFIYSINGQLTREGTVGEDGIEITLRSGAKIRLDDYGVLSNGNRIYSGGEFTYIPNSETSPAAGEYITDSFSIVFTANQDGNRIYRTETFSVAVTGGSDLGASYVVFGKDDSEAIDLTRISNGENGFVIASETNSSSSGFSVSGGRDINGDDRPDILIGAPFGDSYSGAAYAVFTPENNFSDINLAELAEPTQGLSFNTGAGSHFLGYSSALADVNGNGIADVIISAPQTNNNRGHVYVVFDGTENEPVDLSTLEQTGNGFLIDGTWSRFKGRYLDNAGDVNNDGYEDIIIGHGEGDNRIVFGKADSSPVTIGIGGRSGSIVDVDFASIESPYRTGRQGALGITYKTLTGKALSGGGDINGDGISDVLVAEGDVPQDYVEFTLLFGKKDFASVNLDEFSGSITDGFQIRKDLSIDWQYSSTNHDINNTFNYYIPDVYGVDHAAKRLSSDIVGDVNGDGLDDIAFSVNTGFASGNSIYVIFGKRDGLTVDLNQPLSPDDGFRIEVPLDNNRVDRILTSFEPTAAGDVNGDGLADILIGAPFDDADSAANDNAGKSYILFGTDYTNDITQQGTTANDTLTGTTNDESFIGGVGNDTLIGGGGVDVLYGGAGNDRMFISDANFQRIDGGAGTDTLALDGSDFTLNIADVRGKIRNVERIDLTGSGDNTLDVKLRDLLNLSDTSNRLIVTGDAGDKVSSINQNWARGNTQVIDGTTFNTYTNGAAELLVDSQVTAAISATFPDQSFNLAENSTAGVVVGEIEVESTVNNIVNVSFTEASGPFTTEFDANLQKWVVKVQDPTQLDFEAGSLINLEVQTTDSANLTSTAVFSFNFSDVNEAPEFATDQFNFTIAEHSAIGTSIGVANATDQDADDVISYSISAGNDANIFAIDSATGEITVAKAAQLDYESQSSHSLTVRATDQNGLLHDATVDITLTDETTLTYNSSLAFNITDADTSEQYTALANQLETFWDDNISPFLPAQTNWSGDASANESYAFWSNLDLSSGSLNADLPIDVQILMPDGIAPGQQFLIRSAAKLQDTATLEASSPGVDFEVGIDVDFSLDAGLDLPGLFSNVSSDIPDTIQLLAEEDQDHFVQGSFVLDAPTLESNTASVDTAANSLSTQLVNQNWATVDANLSTSELDLWEAAFNTLGIPTEVDISAGEFSFTLDTAASVQGGSPVASAGSYNGNPSVSWTEEDGWTATYNYTNSDYIDKIVWSGDLLGGKVVVNYKESYFNDAFNGGGSPYNVLRKLETIINYNTFDPSLDPRLGLSQYLNLDLNDLQGTIVFTEMLAAGYSLADSSATFDSQFVDGDLTSDKLATSLITVPVNADINGDGVVEFETFVAPVVNLTNYTELDFALDYALQAGSVDYTTTARLDLDLYERAKNESGNLWRQVFYASENPKRLVNNYGSNDYWELTYNSGSVAPALDVSDTVGAGLPLVMASTPDIEQSQAFGGGTQATSTTSLLVTESDANVTGTFSLGLDENGNASDPANFTFTIVGGDSQALEYGQIINNNDGTFTFNLNDAFDFLSEGDYEDVSFQYVATDGNITQTRDVTIIVEGETDYTPLTTLSVSGTNSGTVDVDLTLINGAFDTSRNTYLITHGWQSDALKSDNWQNLVKSTSDYASDNFATGANVIFADWTSAADNNIYWDAAEDTEKVGDEIATYLHNAGVNPTTTTIIGHSLGAHVSGNIGEKWRSLSGNSVDSIFGLDPAGPEFESGSLTGIDKRLDASDANRVIAFHSTAVLGYDGDLGDVDFYLNEWDNLVIPQPGQTNFSDDHAYPIDLLAQLYQGQTFTQNAASDFSQAFGAASFDVSDLTAATTGSFDITTYSVI